MKKLTKEKYKGLLSNPNEWNAGDFVTVEYYEKWKEYFQTQGHLDASPLYYSKTEDFVSAYIIEKSIESYALFMQSGATTSRMLKSYLYLSMMISFLKRFADKHTDKTALQTLTQEFIASANEDLLESIKEQIIKSDHKSEIYKNDEGLVSLSSWLDGGTKVEDENNDLYFSYVDRASKKVFESDPTIMSYMKEHISDIQKHFI